MLESTYMGEREFVVTTVSGPRRVVGVDTRWGTSILSSGTEALLLGRKVAEVEHRPGGGLGRGVVAISHGWGSFTQLVQVNKMLFAPKKREVTTEQDEKMVVRRVVVEVDGKKESRKETKLGERNKATVK